MRTKLRHRVGLTRQLYGNVTPCYSSILVPSPKIEIFLMYK